MSIFTLFNAEKNRNELSCVFLRRVSTIPAMLCRVKEEMFQKQINSLKQRLQALALLF